MKGALGVVRRALRALGPESDEVREAFEAECGATNLRHFRWIFAFLGVLHTGSVIAFGQVPTPTAAHVAWATWLVRIHMALLVISATIAISSIRARSPRVGLWLGDVATVVYTIAGGLISANVQRILPNLNIFIIGLLVPALTMNARPLVFAMSSAVSTGVVVAAVQHYIADPPFRGNYTITAIAIALCAMLAFFVVRSSRKREVFARMREIAAREQVEQLNLGLEDRVAAQVKEITRHSKEIEQLNEQLNQKVRERSRELSMALARLAMDHAALPPGTVLGDRVQLDLRIGEGGMGAVYRGRDLVTNADVAVKVVQAGSVVELDGLYRFLREAQALATLTHPAIVRSFHVDVADDGRLFQIMELVTGETLQALLDRLDRVPQPVAARLGAVLADALASAHRAGVVHRDVKPANVMLTTVSPGIKLLDFGVSKLRDMRAANGHTGGAVIGTPEYLSPEQISDPDHVTDRADVYSLGLVLYLAITSRPPFESGSARSWLLAHVARPPAPIATALPEIDAELAEVVMACLSKSPGARPSAEEAALALAGIADRLGCPGALESLWEPAAKVSAPVEGSSPPPPVTGVQRAELTGRRTLKVVR